MNILISSVGTATSIGFIKLIGRIKEKHRIFGLDFYEYGYTAGSQMVDFFIKSPLANEKNYIEFIIDVIKANKIDKFIPIHDFEIRKISENVNLFANLCEVIIPNIKTLNLIMDKYLCSNFVKSIGIKCPNFVDSNFLGKKILRERISVGSKGITIFKKNEIVDIKKNSFVQEFIEGDEYTVDILNDTEGNPIIVIPRKRIEIKAGVATKVQIIRNNLLIEQSVKILKHIKIPGFCNIQFIIKNGESYFIELNPRFGGFSISSSLVSFNMVEQFINGVKCKNNLDNNLECVKWGSVVTRYYEEVVYR